MDADGSDERILSSVIRSLHGLGPVWSPDGERIAYQRLCEHRLDNPTAPCRGSEVVLVTVNDNDEG